MFSSCFRELWIKGVKKRKVSPGIQGSHTSKQLHALHCKLLWESRGVCKRDFAFGWEVVSDDF